MLHYGLPFRSLLYPSVLSYLSCPFMETCIDFFVKCTFWGWKWPHFHMKCVYWPQKCHVWNRRCSKNLTRHTKVTSETTQSDSRCSQRAPKASQGLSKGSPGPSKNGQKRGPKRPRAIFWKMIDSNLRKHHYLQCFWRVAFRKHHYLLCFRDIENPYFFQKWRKHCYLLCFKHTRGTCLSMGTGSAFKRRNAVRQVLQRVSESLK